MTKDVQFTKLDMESKPYDKVLSKVMDLCPAAVQNGKVDFERLKEELANVIDDNTRETYEFKWVGKSAAMVEANKPIRETLRPCKAESKNWDKTENLYIEGDNLEALKLLEEGYLNKIKMIYIDPPYNTGSDFVYKDNRTQSEDDMNEGIGLFDEEGNRQLSTQFVKNTESSGRFHSDWCSMMYPRLKLARDLLTEDGVIFISIDDNEVKNLKNICDEVFGEINNIGLISTINNLKGRSDSEFFATCNEFLLVYAKNKQNAQILLDKDAAVTTSYNLTEKDGRKYSLDRLDKQSLGYQKSLDFPITGPDGKIYTVEHKNPNNKVARWRWGVDTVRDRYEELVFKYPYVYTKNYEKDGAIPRNLLADERFGRTRTGKTDFTGLFDGVAYFSFPKPVKLIKQLLSISTNKNDIILDFFSGSATTAHAVMQLNAEDDGHRKFIMVQLPEETDDKSEAYKAGYKNICEIGKERIRRAGDKIIQETGKENLDIGFRVLKVDESNMQDVYYKPNELRQAELLNTVDNIKPDRQPLDLLFGVMVDWGVSLTLPLQEIKVGTNTIHIVGDNDLVACFDNINSETIKKMAEFNPTRVVFRDSCFDQDDTKSNMFEIFKTICHWDDKQAKENIRVI